MDIGADFRRSNREFSAWNGFWVSEVFELVWNRKLDGYRSDEPVFLNSLFQGKVVVIGK